MQKKLKISHHRITCPHCGEIIKKEWLFICTADEDIKYIYICPLCEEIIGVYNQGLNKKIINQIELIN
jgi:hypothetical protein